jgi:excisionase family DNA binding protein
MNLEAFPTLGTITEAQRVLRTSRNTIYRLIATGRLRTAKLADGGSSKTLIPKRSLERLISELEGGTP